MADEFRVAPRSLVATSVQMQRCSEEMAAAVEKLRARVLGHDAPWGSDELGTLFAAVYTECTNLALGALGELGQHMGEVAAGMARMAENVSEVDQASADGF